MLKGSGRGERRGFRHEKKKGKIDPHPQGITRRTFIKTVGAGSLAWSGLQWNPVKAWAQGGSKYVWGCPSEFQSMDPHIIYDVTTENLRLNLYDHLYRYLDNLRRFIPGLPKTTASPMKAGNGPLRCGKGQSSITAMK